MADADDRRWADLAREAARDDDWTSDADSGQAPTDRRVAHGESKDFQPQLRAKSHEQLVDLISLLADQSDDVREEVQGRLILGQGDASRLIAQARKELRRVTGLEAWRNNWTGEGQIPSYTKLQRLLKRLMDLGLADAVVELGEELLERGLTQIETSNDEGETAADLGRCMPIVFGALARSSLSTEQRLLYAIDACLRDDLDIVGDAAGAVVNAEHRPEDWSAVADQLFRRLANAATKQRASADDHDIGLDGFHRNYERDRLTSWLGTALEHAARGDEALSLYKKEARITGSYERLVRRLNQRGQDDEVRRWAGEGIAKTARSLPGIAMNLAGQLCDLARKRDQWDTVAAHVAHAFFERPSRELFQELMIAADKAGCQKAVCEFATQFLETGIAPVRSAALRSERRRDNSEGHWPLPTPEYLMLLRRRREERPKPPHPHFGVLIEMAIADKRPDDALRWYEQYRSDKTASRLHGIGWDVSGIPDRVAEAVGPSHPDRAVEIYREQIDQHLVHASVRAYEAVASYLRQMRPMMNTLNRGEEWSQLLQQIGERYKNRPRFLQILDRLENRPIASTRRRR
ncbi:MAG: hypothetical protein IT435_15195 [Phycisphaerales bacterium]|nr:hypothetical protein [Phycisphaerales bacterium]